MGKQRPRKGKADAHTDHGDQLARGAAHVVFDYADLRSLGVACMRVYRHESSAVPYWPQFACRATDTECMRWVAVLSCLVAGCGALYFTPAERAAGRMSVPEQHDAEYRARELAEQKARADREKAAHEERVAELEWRAAHPSEARQVDALRGIEDAIRARRRVHCSSSTNFGQTTTNCY